MTLGRILWCGVHLYTEFHGAERQSALPILAQSEPLWRLSCLGSQILYCILIFS
jgi:hypothetical protein